ncbi:hypothetical protein [Hahella ganghwensis]|uniref:hypothetical protein n=1 Tax=Hahella ganghwensis TaxID=286420 RepID=UPI00036F0672|nr:hypothetical protein [Hahella ganghwensis]
MKKTILFVFLTMLASLCQAERYDVDVVLGEVRIFDKDNILNTAWQGAGYVELPTISQTPDCGTVGNKYALSFSTDNTTMVSMILAAKMANKTVTVTFDDSVNYPKGNFCPLQMLTIK